MEKIEFFKSELSNVDLINKVNDFVNEYGIIHYDIVYIKLENTTVFKLIIKYEV
jgi:hypothetical protein